MPRFVRLRASTYAVLSLDSLVFVATPRLAVSQARVVLESRRDIDVGTALQLARNSRNPFPIPPGSSNRIKTAAAVRRDLLRHLSVVVVVVVVVVAASVSRITFYVRVSTSAVAPSLLRHTRRGDVWLEQSFPAFPFRSPARAREES